MIKAQKLQSPIFEKKSGFREKVGKVPKNMVFRIFFGNESFFDLQGVIWHHGKSLDIGHYSCHTNINGHWYYANDCTVEPGGKFESESIGVVAPYILIYKKRLENDYGHLNLTCENFSNEQDF